MFDGSHYPIEENIEKTKELVATCNKLGLSLEAEVGAIGGEEDGVVGMGECADPKECKMVADLGVTMLAKQVSVTFTVSILQTGRASALKLLTLSSAYRRDAARSPRRYRYSCRHDQEGYLTRRFKDQC